MGGKQSISRSTYSKLLLVETSCRFSFFSFYDITDKLAVVIGSFLYGLIDQTTGSMRNSMLCKSVYFIDGFVLLQLANLKKHRT